MADDDDRTTPDAAGADDDLLERLADAEHASWARWMEYLFSKCERNLGGSLTIPVGLVRRWRRQVETPYAGLSEAEKESDRNEVRLILPLIDDLRARAEAADSLRQVVALLNSMVESGESHTDASRRAVRGDAR